MTRILKFGLVGATCAAIQLILLTMLIWKLRLDGVILTSVANMLAFFISAQVNFLLSRHLTWSDRRAAFQFRQLLNWNTMILVTFSFNQIAFALADLWLQPVVAGVIGISIGSGANYLAQASFVFRRS